MPTREELPPRWESQSSTEPQFNVVAVRTGRLITACSCKWYILIIQSIGLSIWCFEALLKGYNGIGSASCVVTNVRLRKVKRFHCTEGLAGEKLVASSLSNERLKVLKCRTINTCLRAENGLAFESASIDRSFHFRFCSPRWHWRPD